MSTPAINTLEVSLFDRHTHTRNLPFSEHVIPFVTKHSWGSLAMPNTAPKLKTWQEAAEYKKMLQRFSPPGYVWIVTCYLTDITDPSNLEEGFANGTWQAAKLYPAGMTTNSDEGVTNVRKLQKVLERMAKINMPLLVHGEKACAECHPDHAEDRFMTDELPHLVQAGGPIILEHVSAGATANMVATEQYPNIVGATLTPQHLLFDSGALTQTTRFHPKFERGGMTHMVCMPTLKMPSHRNQILDAVRKNPKKFGAGSDIAFHQQAAKHRRVAACGCATPRRVELWATAFDGAGILPLLPDFLGKNLLEYYGLAQVPNHLILTREDCDREEAIGIDEFTVDSMSAGMKLPWTCRPLW
ncbi:MAG: pyrC [Candidatus Taylorbacteria bacterium]|nr:pyrC [Candidatus Taylorbacteria bacterium]